MVTHETWRDWCIETARKIGVEVEMMSLGFVSFSNRHQDYKIEVFIPERFLEKNTTRELKACLRRGAVDCYTGLEQ